MENELLRAKIERLEGGRPFRPRDRGDERHDLADQRPAGSTRTEAIVSSN
jgi:hypothetical protein